MGCRDEGFGPSRAAPWRAGANESTTLTVSHDVQLEGTPLKAGTYALFLELAKIGPWTWILSSNPGWGAFQYDSNDVVLRVPATPQDAPFTEFLTYGFDDRLPSSATAYLQWENKRLPLRIDVPNVNALYVTQMGKDLRAWAGFNYQNWQTAAQFAAANKVESGRGAGLGGQGDLGAVPECRAGAHGLLDAANEGGRADRDGTRYGRRHR